MENKIYYLPIETPNGIVNLEINHTMVNNDEADMSVTLSTTIKGTPVSYQTETTEKALILLAKNLPKNWHIKSCISCRYGHFCPVGNSDNELFCVTDFAPKEPRDLWQVTENEGERKSRSRTLFDCCDYYKAQSKDYFTYSDYYYEVTKCK
ncbi:MAG: hypothetical protein IKB86_00205 [Clostridia bacterium]|nr:hypothetical protein [Clostridia bacterium]